MKPHIHACFSIYAMSCLWFFDRSFLSLSYSLSFYFCPKCDDRVTLFSPDLVICGHQTKNWSHISLWMNHGFSHARILLLLLLIYVLLSQRLRTAHMIRFWCLYICDMCMCVWIVHRTKLYNHRCDAQIEDHLLKCSIRGDFSVGSLVNKVEFEWTGQNYI